MECELRTRRGDNLLLLGSRKLTENSLRDRSWRLDRQGVHEHVRGGRHGGQLARDSRHPDLSRKTRFVHAIAVQEMRQSHQSHRC